MLAPISNFGGALPQKPSSRFHLQYRQHLTISYNERTGNDASADHPRPSSVIQTDNMASHQPPSADTPPPPVAEAIASSGVLLPPRIVYLNDQTSISASAGTANDELECSLHYLPKPLMREFGHVFNDEHLNFHSGDDMMDDVDGGSSSSQLRLLAIPTNQRAREDLVAVGDHIEEEKDRLLNVVSMFDVCYSLYIICTSSREESRLTASSLGILGHAQSSSQFLEFGKHICEQLRSKGYWADYIDPCSGLPMLSLNCNKVYSEVDGMECLLNYKAYNAGFCKILTHPRWGSAVYPATIFAHAPAEVVRSLLESLPVGSGM